VSRLEFPQIRAFLLPVYKTVGFSKGDIRKARIRPGRIHCRIRPYMESRAATLRAAAPGASRAAFCLEGTLARRAGQGAGLHH